MTEVSTPPKMTALTPYGERDEVQALAKRIMALHPASRAIGERGALLLAQLGVALGLNPLPGTGHIHAWVDKGGSLCVHIGLEGRLALARKDSMYSFSTRPFRADEIDLHCLKPGDRGAITELFRHDLTTDMMRLGLPIKPMIGVGIAYAGEPYPKGRSLAWRAAQRSLKDAIRLAFSFSLPKGMPDVNFVESEGHVPTDVLEGEFAVSDEPGSESTDELEKREERDRDRAALFGDAEGEIQPTPETAEIKQSEETIPSTPASAPAEPAPKSLTSYKDVLIKSPHWREMQVEIVKALPRYANKGGKPESIHILNALAAQGVRLINAETTAADLIAELKLRHQEESSEPTEKG